MSAGKDVYVLPKFTEPRILSYGNAEIVDDLWYYWKDRPGVFVLDYDGDGEKELIVGDLLFRRVGETTRGTPIFSAPEAITTRFPRGSIGIAELIPGRGGVVHNDYANQRFVWYDLIGERKPCLEESGVLIEASSGQALRPLLTTHPYMAEVQVIDWDDDGRPDLLMAVPAFLAHLPLGGCEWETSYADDGTWLGGMTGGFVFWHKNVGPADHPRFTMGSPVYAGRDRHVICYDRIGGALAADWNRDGLFDLLVLGGDMESMRLLLFENIGRRGRPEFADPVPIPIGGREDLAEFGAFSAEAIHIDTRTGVRLIDWADNDQKNLLIGRFYGKNVGTLDSPRYDHLEPLQQKNSPLSVSCFAVPHVVDWTGDGRPDLLVGDEAGYIYLFENDGPPGPPSRFKARAKLEAEGKPIRLNSPFGNTGPIEQFFGYTNPVAVDWDGDGDLDIITGTIEPHVYFIENVGTRTEPKLAPPRMIEIDGRPLETAPRIRPAAIDFDGDGLIDLIAVDKEGYLVYCRRYRERNELKLEPPIRLLDEQGQPIWAVGGTQRLRGRTKLTVVDWFKEGRYDIIAGMRCREEQDPLKFFKNVGTNAQPRFRYLGTFPVRRPGGHYQMAELHDWNGDGKLEAITGSDTGSIYYLEQLET